MPTGYDILGLNKPKKKLTGYDVLGMPPAQAPTSPTEAQDETSLDYGGPTRVPAVSTKAVPFAASKSPIQRFIEAGPVEAVKAIPKTGREAFPGAFKEDIPGTIGATVAGLGALPVRYAEQAVGSLVKGAQESKNPLVTAANVVRGVLPGSSAALEQAVTGELFKSPEALGRGLTGAAMDVPVVAGIHQAARPKPRVLKSLQELEKVKEEFPKAPAEAGATPPKKAPAVALAPTPPKIRSAAFRMADGSIVEGTSHPAIANELKQQGKWPGFGEVGKTIESGFVTEKGEFLNRDRALALVGKETAHEIGGPFGIQPPPPFELAPQRTEIPPEGKVAAEKIPPPEPIFLEEPTEATLKVEAPKVIGEGGLKGTGAPVSEVERRAVPREAVAPNKKQPWQMTRDEIQAAIDVPMIEATDAQLAVKGGLREWQYGQSRQIPPSELSKEVVDRWYQHQIDSAVKEGKLPAQPVAPEIVARAAEAPKAIRPKVIKEITEPVPDEILDRVADQGGRVEEGRTETAIPPEQIVAEAKAKEFAVSAEKQQLIDLAGNVNEARRILSVPKATFDNLRDARMVGGTSKVSENLRAKGRSLGYLAEDNTLTETYLRDVKIRQALEEVGAPIEIYQPKKTKFLHDARALGKESGRTNYDLPNGAIFVGSVGGKSAYSEGHILHIGEPPLKSVEQAKAMGIELKVGEGAPNLEAVIPKGEEFSAKPVAFFEGQGKNFQPTEFIVLRRSDGTYTSVDHKYYDAFVAEYPDATFKQGGKMLSGTQIGGDPVSVFNRGKRVGLIMPLRPPEHIDFSVFDRLGATPTKPLPPTIKTPLESAGGGMGSLPIPEGEGTAIPLTPKPGEVIGRADISRFLQEKLNVPIRSGHIAGKWGGIFRPAQKVVRSRVANNLPVIAHEVGHFLDHQFNLRKVGKKDPTYQELNFLGDNTRPDSHSSWKPYRGLDYKLGEGMAEFTRYYLHDPAKAKELAPNLFGKFAKILEENPEIKGAMEQAQADIRRYMEQPSAAKVLSQISIGEQEAKGGIGDKLQSFYTATVDALAPIKRAEKEMGGGKAPANVTESAYELGNLFLKGWMSKATSFVRRGAFDRNLQKVGPGLDEILAPVKNRLDDLRVYMVSKRAIELRERGVNPGVARADAVQAIKELESPELAKAFEQIKEFQDHSLTYLKDGGVISGETFKKMRQMNQDYVPFYRVFEQELPAGVGGKRIANLWSPVKRIKGSGREIVDPLESIVKNVYTYINLADRNRVAQAFVHNAQRIGGQGKFIEDVPTPKHGVTFQLEEIRSALQEAGVEVSTTEMTDLATVFRPNTMAPKGENILTVFHDGKRAFYQVEPTLYRAFLALDNEGMNTLLKALSMPAKVLRAGATLAPEFIARNPIRDQWTGFIQSKYGYRPFYDAFKGLMHAAKKDQTFDYFERSGAMHSILLNLDREYLQKTVNQVTGQQSRLRFFNPVQGMRILSEKGELATRLGEFERGLKKEGTSLEGILRSARAAQEVTVNFSRSGAKTQALNSLIAFWNATVQANTRMVRAFKENPVRTSTKAIAGITVPSVLLYYVNRDNPNYERLPQWQKDLFWIIPLGKNADTFIRIPKPFEMGILFGTTVERSLEWLDKNDPEAFKGLAKTIFEGFTPSFVPTVAVPFIEAFANRSLFTGKPIVPEGLKRLSPELQARPSTSPTLKAIGGLAGVSPLKLESAVRSTAGGLGALALQGIDVAATATGLLPSAIREKRETLQQIPVLRGLTAKTEIFSSDVVEQFYDRFEEAERLLADYKNLKQSGQTEKAKELRESEQFKRLTFWDGEAGTRRNRLRGTYDLLSDLRKRRQQIVADQTLDVGQKRALLEKNSRRVFEVVERKLKVAK